MNEPTESEACLVAAQHCHLVSYPNKQTIQNCLKCYIADIELMCFILSFKGNHETDNMNQMYGFEGEVKAKYTAQMFQLFSEVFQWLPLAQCINNKVLVRRGPVTSYVIYVKFIVLSHIIFPVVQ